jgi:MFS family permease
VGGFACIGGGLFGLDISSMSGVLSVSRTTQFSIRTQYNIILLSVLFQNNHYKDVFSNPGPNAQGAIVASMPAGSLVGALFVTWLGDKIGRKKTIILAGMIWVLGSILQCA